MSCTALPKHQALVQVIVGTYQRCKPVVMLPAHGLDDASYLTKLVRIQIASSKCNSTVLAYAIHDKCSHVPADDAAVLLVVLAGLSILISVAPAARASFAAYPELAASL